MLCSIGCAHLHVIGLEVALTHAGAGGMVRMWWLLFHIHPHIGFLFISQCDVM